MPTHYFLGSRLLATSRQLPQWSDHLVETDNLVFICTKCGETWGRVIVEAVGNRWQPISRGCAAHPDTDQPGGTFIAPWRQTFAELPPEVLAYELQIRLDQYPADKEPQ
jgi:hypothetical protein